jgi:hypothetical protein
MRTSRAKEMSTTFGIIEVPSDLEPGGRMDYLEKKTMYKKFWTKCHKCFMERVPKDWTIWEYEE